MSLARPRSDAVDVDVPELTPQELRVVEAVEAVRVAARAVGIEPDQIAGMYLPLRDRVDLWLARSSRLLDDESWRRIDAAHVPDHEFERMTDAMGRALAEWAAAQRGSRRAA